MRTNEYIFYTNINCRGSEWLKINNEYNRKCRYVNAKDEKHKNVSFEWVFFTHLHCRWLYIFDQVSPTSQCLFTHTLVKRKNLMNFSWLLIYRTIREINMVALIFFEIFEMILSSCASAYRFKYQICIVEVLKYKKNLSKFLKRKDVDMIAIESINWANSINTNILIFVKIFWKMNVQLMIYI